MIRRTSLAALALVLLGPALAASQEPPEPEPVPLPSDSVQLALARFQTLQQRVGMLQQEVLEGSPALQAHQAEVAGLVEAAVLSLDPTLQTDIDTRMPGLQQEAEAARAAADTTALAALEAEYVALRTRAGQAEDAALAQPEIRDRIEGFEDALRFEMASRDPDIEAALAELEVLAGRLGATLGGG